MADVYETLLKAIKEHSGMEESEIIEAGEHGADAGWAGFSYYEDTGEFYEKYEDAIWELLEENAESMGEKHPLALIATFKGAQDVHGADQFENLLAWFALEEVGRWLADREEEKEKGQENEDKSEPNENPKKSQWYLDGYAEGQEASQVSLTEKQERADLEKYFEEDRLGEFVGEIREHQVQMAGDISYEVGQPGGPTERQYELWEEGFTDGFIEAVEKELGAKEAAE